MRIAIKKLVKFAVIIAIVVFGTIVIGMIYHAKTAEPDVDDSLVVYVDSWKADCEAYGIDYKDEYTNLIFIEQGDAGCGRSGRANTRSATIVISPGYSYHETMAIVYHELGHAVFDLDHSHGIMAKQMADPGYYENNWIELVDVYFNQIKEKR